MSFSLFYNKVIDNKLFICYNCIIKRKEIRKMTGKEMIEILEKIRAFDNTLRYWIFKEYIEDYNDLEFLKAEIECEIEKRKE